MIDVRQWLYGALVGIGALVACTGPVDRPQANALYLEVDPMIGTDWVGNTYPGASVPHGMVQLSPDNGLPGWDRIAGYYYPDSTIAGFSHTHLSGTGAGDMYDISFMPIVEPALRDDSSPLGLHARFSHQHEEASAGYYSVLLDPYNIRVELTATEHAGVQRYTFLSATDSALVILDLGKQMNWDKTLDSQIEHRGATLSGYRHSDGWARDQRVYFHSALSREPDSVEIVSQQITDEQGASIGYARKALLRYRVQAGDTLVITTALSGVDLEGAKSNHRAETPHFDFARYRQAAEELWQYRLSRITVEGATAEERTILYTALYHAHLCPTLYSDVDGRYRGPDKAIHKAPEGTRHYSTFSLWDTYRAAHPLYNLIAPELNRDMVQSMIDFGEQNAGHLPVWNMWASETDMMIGYHSVPVIVEAILRGVYRVDDPSRLTALLRSTAERTGYRGLDEYRTLGYVPADKHRESLSLTLEYAYDDAAIAAWGRYIGDTLLASTYTTRAQSYRRVWDAETRFFRPRLSDGGFQSPFDPFAYTEDITESNAYQYLTSVQHDVQGLTTLMGGRDSLARRLDDFFAAPTPQHIKLPIFSTGMIGQYAHGNEPGHHVPFLYNKVGQPWKTSRLTLDICRRLYTNAPSGLCGNEDCGQMSAWYIFASLGLYPLDPLSGQYELTTPLFARAELIVQGGKCFAIEKQGQGDYIRRVLLDGKPIDKSYITYEQITSGGHLLLEMTTEEGICWY